MSYTVILELESIGLADLTTVMHGFSDREAEFLSPAGEQYLPLLDTTTLPSVTTAVFEEGRTGGTAGTASSKLKLVRHVSGRDRLAFLEDREIAGRPARLIAVGDLPNGQSYSYADPYVIADGEVGPTPVLYTERLELEIRRRANVLERKVPSATYNGLGEGLLFDGIDDGVTTPLVFQPGDATVLGWVYVPRQYIGATPQTLASNDSVTVRLSAFTTRQVEVVYQSAPGVFATVQGPVIPELERLYFWAVRWTAAGDLTVWLDQDRVEASGITIHDAGTAWSLGATPSGLERFEGLAGGWAFFDVALGDDKIEEHRVSAPLGSEEGLVAYYGGESDSGTLFDLAQVNNPPIDATIDGGAVAINLLEGGAGLRGNLKRRIFGWAENVLGLAVDPTRLIYQWAGGPIQRFIEIYDRQSPFEIEVIHDSLIDFFLVPPTADGKVTVFPRLALARFYSLPDSAMITADLLGESPWAMSRVLEPDGWLSWGTSLNGYFSSSFTWEFAFSIGEEVADQTLFATDTWSLVYTEHFLEFERVGWVIQLAVAVNTPGGLDGLFAGLWARIEAGASHFCSAAINEAGGVVTASLYLDGQLQAQNTMTGSLLAPSSDFQAGRGFFFPWQEAQGVHVSEVRLWPTARTQDEIRAALFETGSLPGAAGLWRGREDQATTIPDEIGSNDAQLMGSAGRLAPGVYAGSAVSIAWLLLHELGEITAADIDLAAAFEIDASPQSLVLDKASELREALARILDGLNASAYASEIGTVIVRQMLDPDTASLDGVIYEHEIDSIEPLPFDRPASVWEIGYRPVWHQQEGDDVAQGADPERSALVSKPRRYIEACEPDNTERFPSAQPRQTTDSNLRFASAARREAERQKALRKSRRSLWKIKLVRGLAPYHPGGVYEVHHCDLPGGQKRLLVLSKTDDIRTATLKGWG